MGIRPASLIGFLLLVLLAADAASDGQPAPAVIHNGNPDWHPSRNLIAFSSNRGGNEDLYTVDADSLALLRLTDTPADELHVSWSPDGAKLVFDSNRSGNFDLWMMNADGSGAKPLTDTPDLTELVPCWSPDGRYIAFNGRDDKGFDLYLLDLRDGTTRRLTDDPGDEITRGWSADGSALLFNSDRTGDHEIWRIDIESGAREQWTHDPADDRIARVSPAGDLFFSRSSEREAGGRALYRQASAAASAERFFDSPHEDFYPAWSADGLRMAVVIRAGNGSQIYELLDGGHRLRLLTRDTAP